MKRWHLRLLAVAAILLAGTGCKTIKPYEKEYLLSPLMDDGTTARLKPGLMAAGVAQFERFGGASGAGSESSSCPTCGG